MNKKFYISTAIPYVNAAPHIGFALEIVLADSLARYNRMLKKDVFFLTGVDEHGVKLFDTAKEAGIDVQEFADMNAEKFKALKEGLNLSNDDFIRTTSDRHKRGAQKLWSKMFEKGDIYKDSYKGNYCSGCEAFILDKDLDGDGNCPVHKRKPKLLEEENYFFKLSKYSDKIKQLILSDELLIIPDARKNEMLNIIGEEGLFDVSFSRPKNILPWGINVPNDDSQVMYVWCDALSNYITALGYEKETENYKKFWPGDVHLIGKDILRFHAGIWIGMLLSAGIKIPKAIYVHGFVTSEGQKMSKSIGNVVDPQEYVKKYGIDALRYYLVREIPTTDDGDFSHKRFLDVYNSELANGLGNLLNRVLMMTERYCESKVPKKNIDKDMSEKISAIIARYQKSFEKFDLKFACENIAELINFGNKYIDDKKPWAMAKAGDMDGVSDVLFNLNSLLFLCAGMVYPIIPQAALKIFKCFGIEKESDIYLGKFGEIESGLELKRPEILFPKIEE
ncbi:MAG: methionine--tRNA ligase [Candidatus Gracilibacteria bacterium]